MAPNSCFVGENWHLLWQFYQEPVSLHEESRVLVALRKFRRMAVGETAQMSYDFIRLGVCHLKRHAFVLCRRVLGREFCG